MIYTVTFNPSIDYVVRTDEMALGQINRAVSEHVFAGGKGVNVAVMLANLGYRSRALGFTAGFTGTAIEQMLIAHGCDTDFIRLKRGNSRINVKIHAREESELNGQGPDIDGEAIEALLAKLDRLDENDTLVLAGSAPPALPSDIYALIAARMEKKGVRTVVDASGRLLVGVLKYHPYLIKPNHHELGEIFGKKLKSREDIIQAAKSVQQLGARHVLVSMAADGAIFISESGEICEVASPQGEAVNSVGAGDAMVAGFLAGLTAGKGYDEALKLAAAAGSATAFTEWIATRAQVDEQYARMGWPAR